MLFSVIGRNGSPGLPATVAVPRTWLVVGGTFRAIRVINLTTGEQSRLTIPANADWDVAFDRTGHRLVTAGINGTVQLRRFRPFAHVGSATDVTFDPTGQTLVSGSADNTVRLWDVERGELLHRFTGPTETAENVTFRPDGKIFASAGDDGTVRLWNPTTGAQ